jgi:hypothetical protein
VRQFHNQRKCHIYDSENNGLKPIRDFGEQLGTVKYGMTVYFVASKRSIINAYTTGRDDGSPGVHPGHTPYINTDDWYTGMIMGKPSWMTDKCYPAYSGWPKAEGYFNTRYVWAHSEFTPQQTMRGKAALYGYLYGLTKSITDYDGDSDVDVLDLAVFCDSWLKVPADPGYEPRANLYADPSGIVDLFDFAVFANAWAPPLP